LALKAIILNDLKRQNRGFYGFSSDFWLRHIFQKRIAPKSVEIDRDNLRMKLSAFNLFFTSLNFAFLYSRNWVVGKCQTWVPLSKYSHSATQTVTRTVAPSA